MLPQYYRRWNVIDMVLETYSSPWHDLHELSKFRRAQEKAESAEP
jgi:hypothetical protein